MDIRQAVSNATDRFFDYHETVGEMLTFEFLFMVTITVATSSFAEARLASSLSIIVMLFGLAFNAFAGLTLIACTAYFLTRLVAFNLTIATLLLVHYGTLHIEHVLYCGMLGISSLLILSLLLFSHLPLGEGLKHKSRW